MGLLPLLARFNLAEPRAAFVKVCVGWLLVEDLQHVEVFSRRLRPLPAFVCKRRAFEQLVDVNVVIAMSI